MALAKKCDRCDKHYEPYGYDKGTVNAIKTVSYSADNRNYCDAEKMDFCPTCLKSFYAWFDEYKIERKNNGKEINRRI